MEAELTPKQIVRELDEYIVGQSKAKRAVAIAMRNRWRRLQTPEALRDEIVPNNIIMIGSTGVGKTEIARRLANLANAPFIKVEASKFTEVGYVGRDVESIIRDLTDIAVNMVKKEKEEQVREKAVELAEERLLDLIFPADSGSGRKRDPDMEERHQRTRQRMREKLLEGKLEDHMVELDVREDTSMPAMQVFGVGGFDEISNNLKDMLSNVMPGQKKRRKLKVSDARQVLIEREAQKLVDQDEVIRLSIDRVENHGIVFLDEIDKITGDGSSGGPDVSREGVQRDLLPIVEGSSVPTKYGRVQSEHVLFIAAGAFHTAAPSDMIPELQGRFPIRVEMNKLNTNDFVKILEHPKTALIKQYTALMNSEKIDLKFEPAAIREIARIATEVNNKTENIGARRLHTIMTTLLDDYLFEEAGRKRKKTITISKKTVTDRLADIVEDQDLSRYIL